MNKTIPIMSMISIMALVSIIPSVLAANDTMTPPMTPGYHKWHGTMYAVCPPGIPAPCANYLPGNFNKTFLKIWGGIPFISGPDTK